MWLLYAVTPLTVAFFGWVYSFERYRWRRGYYHVHQCVEWLEGDDVAVQWTALDHLANVRMPSQHAWLLLVLHVLFLTYLPERLAMPVVWIC